MKRTPRLLVVSCLLGAASVAAVTVGPAAARSSVAAIGPRQHFIGLVNGHTSNAIIAMVCTPPLDPGQKGHPLGGQTVAVEPPPSVARTTGDTGSRGQSVVASFLTTSTAATPTITFTHYGSQPIPDTFTLPCGGAATVVFSPAPTSKTAHAATVSVTYGNITAGPPSSRPAVHAQRTVTVTRADNGKSFTLRRADHLLVRLSGPGAYTWTEPTSSDPSVLHRTGGSGGPNATAVFVARTDGTGVSVTAVDNPNCYPQCLAPSFLFSITVSVTG